MAKEKLLHLLLDKRPTFILAFTNMVSIICYGNIIWIELMSLLFFLYRTAHKTLALMYADWSVKDLQEDALPWLHRFYNNNYSQC